MKYSSIITRTVVFVLAAFFALQAGPVLVESKYHLREASAILPALSPFAVLCGILSARHAGWIAFAAVPVLVLSFARGRWFCRWMCPTGLLSALAWKIGITKIRTPWAKSAGRFIALAGIGAAVLGSGLFIWLDPLAIFNGFFSSLWPPVLEWTLPIAIALPAVVIIALFAPFLWCYGLCPLGALQEMLGGIRRLGDRQGSVHSGRRAFLACGAGLALGAVLKKALPHGPAGEMPIRPPGAVPEGRFAGTCERCGNCVRACPTHVIRPDTGRFGIAGLLAPVIEIDQGVPGSSSASAYCEEYCNECNKVCPTGAIRRLTTDQKVNIRIGTAKVDRNKCIAWSRAAFCMVCHEFCPYSAVKTVVNNKVNCPEVNVDACRGCGLCQVQCPSLNGKAIVVHGRVQERALAGLRTGDQI